MRHILPRAPSIALAFALAVPGVAVADGLIPQGFLPKEVIPPGLTFNADLVGEAAGNPVGGLEQGGAYAQELHVGADYGTGALGWDGGILHLTITERVGSSLSKDKIGNLLTVQEIYGDGQTVRITELAYEQKLFNGRMDVTVGRQNVEQDLRPRRCISAARSSRLRKRPGALPLDPVGV